MTEGGRNDTAMKQSRGFTLFEMILALFLTTVLLGSIAQIGITLVKSLNESRQERLFLSRLILLDQQLRQMSPTLFRTENDPAHSGRIHLQSEKAEGSVLLFLEHSKTKNSDLLKMVSLQNTRASVVGMHLRGVRETDRTARRAAPTLEEGKVLIPDLMPSKSALTVEEGSLKILLVSGNGLTFENRYFRTPKSLEMIQTRRK